MNDNEREATLELLEELANMLRGGAIYIGHRRDGANDEFEYGSLLFKWPRKERQHESLT